MASNGHAPSKALGIKVIGAAFDLLKKNDGSLPASEIMKLLPQKVELTEYDKFRYENTGLIRWQSMLNFYSIDSVKAGFLVKQNGNWILTEEGEKAMKMGNEKLFEAAAARYREWQAARDGLLKEEGQKQDADEDVQDTPYVMLEATKTKAREGFTHHIALMGEYDFQRLVAALLKGMGYFINFIAPRGPDGGIDIIAHQDPIGIKSPRIVVQVKHKPEAAIPVTDIRHLQAVISPRQDAGLFVTSGRFTSEAEKEARRSNAQIELIDFSRFLSLWIEYYPKMKDEDKALMPLQPIYFLASTEQV